MSSHSETYSRWAALFVDYLCNAAQLAIALEEIREEWHEPFVPELGYIDIRNPQSGLCKLIRRGVAMGLFKASDLTCLAERDSLTPVNWKEDI